MSAMMELAEYQAYAKEQFPKTFAKLPAISSFFNRYNLTGGTSNSSSLFVVGGEVYICNRCRLEVRLQS